MFRGLRQICTDVVNRLASTTDNRRTTVNQGPSNQPFNAERDPRKNVEINIGKACNNRCVFCIDGLPKREDRTYMDYEAMKSELSRWYGEGHRSVGF